MRAGHGYCVEFIFPPSTLLLLSLWKSFGILLTSPKKAHALAPGAVSQETKDPHRHRSSPGQGKS